jgi:hypothetical protein
MSFEPSCICNVEDKIRYGCALSSLWCLSVHGSIYCRRHVVSNNQEEKIKMNASSTPTVVSFRG